MTTTPTAFPAEAAPTVTALQPASTGRRVVAWLIDIVIVAALVGAVYLVGLIKINGCDTWDPATQQFGGSCPFESTREVTRADGSVDLVYVLDSGRELPADHPTVKTVFLGTRIVDPPSAGTYLVGLGYVLVVYVLVQGFLGWTPGKLLAGIRLARPDGRSAGVPGAFVRWLVIDGVIGLFGVVMGLVGTWWPLRLLAADAALLLVGGVVALVAGGRQPGDRVAGTLVVDEAALALRRASAPVGPAPAAAPTGPTPWGAADLPATAEHGAGAVGPAAAAGAAAAAAAGATFAAGRSGPAEPVEQGPGQATTTDPGAPGAAPTPLPRWPTPEPAGPQPVGQGPGAGAAGTQPATQPSPAEPRAERAAPPTATPLGASVGAAPSALRPRDPGPAATTPADTPTQPVGEPSATSPASTPGDHPTPAEAAAQPATETSTETRITAAGDPAVDEPAPVAEEPGATAAATTSGPTRTEGAPGGSGAPTEPEPEPDQERDALVTTSVAPGGGPSGAAEDTPGAGAAGTGEAASAPAGRQPEWDEARRAYIFWDDSRQEWLQFFDDSQSWGPITRA